MENNNIVKVEPRQDRTGRPIQDSLDEMAARGGGTVLVPAGVYDLQAPVRLRDGVRLVGEAGVVLRKVPSVSTPLADYLGYGHFEVTVAEPEKFPVGTGIHILDDGAPGFYTTCAIVVWREGNCLLIDRMLAHDYSPAANGRAVSAFPMIEACGVRDAGVENLTLDGNVEETFTLNGCRGAGVYLLGSQRIEVNNVEVTHFRGDAISFQQCTDVTVRGCRVHHNTGGGVHPGSGSVRYVIENNDVHDNGAWGIFYCLRTTHSLCSGNRLTGNGESGISIGERDTDHLIRGNTIAGNHGHAVEFRRPLYRGGDRVRIESNLLGPNHASAEIHIAANVQDVEVIDNRFVGTSQALFVEAGCRRIWFAENRAGDRPANLQDLGGDPAALNLKRPTVSSVADWHSVGPEGIRHLSVSKNPTPGAA